MTARLLRKTIALASLAVPFLYLVYAFVDAGIVRKELLSNSVLARFIRLLLIPVTFLNEKVFAVPLVVHRFDMVLVGCGLLTIVVREVILAPFHKAEAWAEEKLAPPVARKHARPPVRPASALCRS